MPEKAKIFIAEDDAALRRALKAMLKIRGHSVVLEASSLSKALKNVEKAKALGVNVAIIDGSLGDPDSPGYGPKIAEALRKEVPGIKIVSFPGIPESVKWGNYSLGKWEIGKMLSLIRSI